MAKRISSKQPAGKSRSITPLWIVSAFVTLTESVLGYALTQVTGGVQVALTSFVIIFATLVAGAFFLILWNRPYVFYSPGEYGDVDPRHFADAMRDRIPAPLADQIREAEAKPDDEKAQFALINSLIDEPTRQHIILMNEKQIELSLSDYPRNAYQLGGKRSWSNGSMAGNDMYKKLAGTELLEIVPEGPKIRLTESGRDFAKWLVETGKKAQFLQSSLGGWGTPSFPEDMPQEFKEKFTPQTLFSPRIAFPESSLSQSPSNTAADPTGAATSTENSADPKPHT